VGIIRIRSDEQQVASPTRKAFLPKHVISRMADQKQASSRGCYKIFQLTMTNHLATLRHPGASRAPTEPFSREPLLLFRLPCMACEPVRCSSTIKATARGRESAHGTFMPVFVSRH